MRIEGDEGERNGVERIRAGEKNRAPSPFHFYALTQADGQAGLSGKIVNTTASSLFGGMITRTHIGGESYQKRDVNGALMFDAANNPIMINQNPYPSINAILGKLGISSSTEPDHQHHFHIYLKPPTPEQIGPNHLLADAATALAFDLADPATLQSEAQGVVSYTQTLIEGEELMFIMDVPAVPAQETPIVLAQAAAPAAGDAPSPDFIFNVCKETESTGDPMSAMRGVNPVGMLATYMNNYQDRDIDMDTRAAIKPILLQDTTHGKLNRQVAPNGAVYYMYAPPPNYVGNDKAIFQVEFEGKVYKIVVELRVFLMVNEYEPTCPPPQLIKVKKPATGSSGYDMGSITVTFADLDGAAIGLTNASGITLDTNAAGHNWFIDTTPWDNSEYLATSNPYEWVAKEGTAAYGKMDMLSVLLHEYGHALGIDHSMDNHDYMATTLQAGVRRLPSAEEMALMQQLVAQAKMALTESTPTPSLEERLAIRLSGQTTPAKSLVIPLQGGGGFPVLPLGTSFLGFLGLLRGSRYGGVGIAPDASTLVTQYAVAANSTLTNGNLNAADGWSTQGSVDIGNGMAVMNEVSARQTRLSQVFMGNDRDRFLSFTLSGTALDDLTGAPDDAFEVALLDANSGASLLGTIGLTRSDAFLNTRKEYAGGCPATL